MEKIRSLFLKYIGQISITLGIINLLALCIYHFNNDLKFLLYFNFMSFYDMIWELTFKNGIRSLLNIPTVLFHLILIVGGIQYLRSNKKETVLLRFAFSILTISFFIGIFSLILNFFSVQKMSSRGYYNNEIPTLSTYFFRLLRTLIFFSISYFITSTLLRSSFFDNHKSINKKTIFESLRVSKIHRFFHFIIDSILTIFFLGPLIGSLLMTFDFGVFSGKQFISLWLALALFIYYLISEGLLRTTPGKCLTGAILVHSLDFKTPTFGSIIARTLSRRIPFDLFSFLGSRGWHDSLPNIHVVYDTSYVNKSKNFIWFILFIGSYVSCFTFDKIVIYKEKEAIKGFIDLGRDKELINQFALIDTHTVFHFYNSGTMKCARCISNRDDKIIGLLKDCNGLNKNKEIQQLFSDTSSITGFEIEFSNSSLKESFRTRNSDVELIKGEKKFRLNEISRIHYPEIRKSSSSYKSRDSIQVYSFQTKNSPLEIIDIKTMKGDIRWQTALPLKVDVSEVYNTGRFTIEGKIDHKLHETESEITIRVNGNVYLYKLETRGNTTNFYRIK